MSSPVHWLQPPRPGQPALLCLPYAGGDGHLFRHWAAELSTLAGGVALGWAELPGRGAHFGMPPLTRIEAQRDWLLPALQALPAPLTLFGHSMGALTAFELAHALRARGSTPLIRVMVAAHEAPGRLHGRPALHTLPESAFIERLGRFAGTPEEVLQHPELLALMIPRLRADFEACETYRPPTRQPLDVPLVAYGGADDPDVPPSALLHWAPLTQAGFEAVVLPGHHFFLHHAREALLRDIARRLKPE